MFVADRLNPTKRPIRWSVNTWIANTRSFSRFVLAIWLLVVVGSTPVQSDELNPGRLLDSFSTDDLNTSFARLHYLASLGHNDRILAAVAVRLDTMNPEVRFAANYLLAHIADGSQVPLLANAMQDDIESFRAIAAGALIGLGHKPAIPILIEALSSNDKLPYSDPPRSVSVFSQRTLEAYIDEEFRPQDESDWANWWLRHNEQLMWSETLIKYVLQ